MGLRNTRTTRDPDADGTQVEEEEVGAAVEPAPRSTELDPVARLLPAILKRLVGVDDRLAQLTDRSDSLLGRIQSLDQQREIENKMYAELEELRRDDASRRALPLVMDIIHVLDRLDENASDAPAIVSSIGEQLVEALRRNGVEQIRLTEADPFDPRLQRPLGTLPSHSAREVSIVRPGYQTSDRVVRHQEVYVRATQPTGIKPPVTTTKHRP